MNGECKVKRRIIALSDIDDIVKYLPKLACDDAKRQLRKCLFEAFDVHKGNIEYGAETETTEEKEKILLWRKDLKDLKTEAFKEIPKAIKYYIGG